MNREQVRVSRFLSLVLRHKPETIGITLDRGGWARVDELLAGARRVGVPLTMGLLQVVVAQNDKQRFSFSEDGLRIRAKQGHSIPVDLGLEPQPPPELLYHGTATRFLQSIRERGLLPGNRAHVHLSLDVRTAVSVGKRHGRPVVLVVQAGRMHRDGLGFYLSENGVWMTRHVPVEYVIFPER